jgi:hypothetical protein
MGATKLLSVSKRNKSSIHNAVSAAGNGRRYEVLRGYHIIDGGSMYITSDILIRKELVRINSLEQ